MSQILLTGGTGFIGSHTAVELLQAGYDVIIADDLSNSSADVVASIETITGIAPKFYQVDVTDSASVEAIFSENQIDAVMHFAGLKVVGESMAAPLMYYRNNLDSTLTLLEAMKKYGCKKIVFSSSATIYGPTAPVPVTEDAFTGGSASPYGWTKYMIEQILTDTAKADPTLSVMLLRYFNPIGAHESGLIGEIARGIPNNLMPYVTQVAAGVREQLSVFGNDYPTPDGSGIRDFIHVVDLAKGHVAALDYMAAHTGTEAINLGTGRGFSVLELIHAFETATGVSIPYVIAPRRTGDIPISYADVSKAKRLLGWTAEKTLEDMCRDSWRWQQNCSNNT